MVDKSFAQRMNTACDQNPRIPPYGHGRQTFVQLRMGVSHEAVRKWFLGETRPRPDKMTQLASVLECDEAWLALGKKGDLDPRDKRGRNLSLDGAVNVVTGLLQLNGASCAFPADKDPMAAFVDIYAIRRGVQLAIHVALGVLAEAGEYHFAIPKEYELCKTIGVVHTQANKMQLLDLDNDTVTRGARRRGGYLELVVTNHDSAYWVDDVKLRKIESFAKDL